MKYIKIEGGEFITFPDIVIHAELAKCIPNSVGIVSAGFVAVIGGKSYCVGSSESLGLDSLPEDTEELEKWLMGGGV